MSHVRPPLAAFDDESFETVAAETDMDVATLREVASDHQEAVRELPGVDDIVYEWRTQFHQDPLVERDDGVYVLAVRDHVWREFADDLDVDDGALAALKRVHDRQARRLVDGTARFDADSALVLTRP